jgi:hypothetical protein
LQPARSKELEGIGLFMLSNFPNISFFAHFMRKCYFTSNIVEFHKEIYIVYCTGAPQLFISKRKWQQGIDKHGDADPTEGKVRHSVLEK